MGFDLNRHWQEPSPWAHPTLYATKNLLLEYDRDDVSPLRERVYIYKFEMPVVHGRLHEQPPFCFVSLQDHSEKGSALTGKILLP